MMPVKCLAAFAFRFGQVRRFFSVLPQKPSPSAELTFLHECSDLGETIRSNLLNDVKVLPNFVSDAEESSLLEEAQFHLKRLRYEKEHWDHAIHDYREVERSQWNATNAAAIQRIREAAFPPDTVHIGLIHVLDISKAGFIKPHIDSVRYCGDTVAGLSLLSDSVMRLRHNVHESVILDLLLNRRSLYILSGIGRYDFKHELLSDSESYFAGRHIARDRRISIICRSVPHKSNTS